MDYGISSLAIIPMRAEPAERSEMVSQLLFGETYQITEWQEKWVKIITAYDEYEGWISRNQVTTLNYEDYLTLQENSPVLTTEPVTMLTKTNNNSQMLLPAGCILPFYEDGICQINQEVFKLCVTIQQLDNLIATAQTYLNSPYLWGGRTHFGLDCSGFVQNVFKQHGLFLKRDASQQAEQGTTVDFLQEVKPGDLAFFDNAEGRIVHVGLMLNNEQIIHASGKVRVDRLDSQGIYAEDQKRHTHQLRIIKRYF